MNTSRKLGAAFVLTIVLGLTAFADCPQPIPGQTDTMPCAAAQLTPDDFAAPGETSTPPASNEVDILSVADMALNLLLIF